MYSMNLTQISPLEKHLHVYTRRPGQNAYGSIVMEQKLETTEMPITVKLINSDIVTRRNTIQR